MKSFYIDANGSVQLEQATSGRAKKDARHFTSEKEWTRIAGDLPMARLVGIWNRLPGFNPVERFTSRAKAARRIWKAIEGLQQNADPYFHRIRCAEVAYETHPDQPLFSPDAVPNRPSVCQ